MSLNYFNKLLLAPVISVSTLIGCSGGGGSSSSGPEQLPATDFPKITSQYKFSVDNTEFTNNQLKANSFRAKSDQLAELPVFVVVLDANSVVTGQTIEVINSEFSAGQYTVQLATDARADVSIIVDVNGQGKPNAGDELQPENYLYYPAVETDEAFVISLESTVIYDVFLSVVESFDNIFAGELDSILDEAISLASEVKGSSLAELISGIRETVEQYVEINSLLAEATIDIPTATSNATIEEDRADIKAFFDELNTMYVLSQNIINVPEEEENNQLRDLADTALSIQDTVQAGATVYEALDTAVNTFKEFFENIKATETDQVKDIATLFSGDENSSLTGTITYNSSRVEAVLSGRYGEVNFTNLNVQLNTVSNDLQVTITGTAESPTARLVVNQAHITATSDLVSAGVFGSEETAIEFGQGLNAAIAEMDVVLSTKGDSVATFTGSLRVTGVRSTDKFVEFAVAEGEEAGIQSFYNYEFANVEGTLTLSSSSVHVLAEATSDNARSYVPKTQGFIAGQNYDNVFSYDYNGTDKFVIRHPDQVKTYELSTKDQHSLYVSDQHSRDQYTISFEGTLDELLQQRALSIYVNEISENFNLDLNTFVKTISNEVQLYQAPADNSDNTLAISYIYTDQIFQYSYLDYSSLTEVTYSVGEDNTYKEEIIKANNENYSNVNYSTFSEYINGKNHKHWSDFNLNVYNGSNCFSYYRMPANYQFIEGENSVTLTLDNFDQCQASDTIEVSYSFDSDSHLFWDVENEHENYIEYNFHSVTTAPGNFLTNTYLYNDGDSYSYGRFLSLTDTFNDYLTQRYVVNGKCLENNSCSYQYDSVKFLGDFRYALPELKVGNDTSISALLQDADSLVSDEFEDNFLTGKVSATITTVLDGLGTTVIDATAVRTGINHGVFTLSIDHSDITANETRVRFIGAIIDEKLDNIVVNSDSGFAIDQGNIEQLEEDIRITYGRETAVVSKTKVGLKVTYSDGSFNNY
jgi:hypothetical protein